MKRKSGVWKRMRGNRKRKSPTIVPKMEHATRHAAAVVQYRSRALAYSLGRSLPYVLIALIAAIVPMTLVYGYRYVMVAPSFRVQEVQVEGNVRLSAQDVLATAGIDQSPNLLALDLSDVEGRLTSTPWIRTASVKRALPDRLIVEVQEHKPTALIALGSLYMVDELGAVFRRVASGEHYDLPILTGLTRRDFAPAATGERASASRSLIQGALMLMANWSDGSVGRLADIGEIHMDPLFGYSVVLDSTRPEAQGAFVVLGRGNLDNKLGKLETVIADAVRRSQVIETVRLNDQRDSSRVTVRFRPQTPTENSEQVGSADTAEGPNRLPQHARTNQQQGE